MSSFSASWRIGLFVAAFLCGVNAIAQGDEYQQANNLFRAGQPAEALERLDNLLKAHPKDARGRFLKGLILTEQNKRADAIAVFIGLVQDYPELPEPYNNLGVLYASQGEYDKARTALEMAIRTHPGYATAHENLGDIYAKMASQEYDRALQVDKSNAGARTKLKMIQELFPAGGVGQKPAADKSTPAGKAPLATPDTPATPATTKAPVNSSTAPLKSGASIADCRGAFAQRPTS